MFITLASELLSVPSFLPRSCEKLERFSRSRLTSHCCPFTCGFGISKHRLLFRASHGEID